ncbi:hypothetical protein DN443_03120 [Lactobacillus reuteri]|nr:hypothetical protein [Limosilactobacillus reuteri]MQC04228.1 hypothetical protein [Limosilactobacillus reuteri]
MATNFINNLKSGLRFLNRSKIVVRILLLENQELIVNSQPLLCFILMLVNHCLVSIGNLIRC